MGSADVPGSTPFFPDNPVGAENFRIRRRGIPGRAFAHAAHPTWRIQRKTPEESSGGASMPSSCLQGNRSIVIRDFATAERRSVRIDLAGYSRIRWYESTFVKVFAAGAALHNPVGMV